MEGGHWSIRPIYGTATDVISSLQMAIWLLLQPKMLICFLGLGTDHRDQEPVKPYGPQQPKPILIFCNSSLVMA